jgi:hypothetical protein
VWAVLLCSPCAPAAAQGSGDTRAFAGGLFGVSTLSGDATAETTATSASLSMYAPENGPAVNLFAGVHFAEYVSAQVNWIWNRNDLTLFSSFTQQGGGFYEQPRRSEQHAFVADALVYFRRRDSAIRPYLGTGLAVVRFSSDAAGVGTAVGLPPPAGTITSTKIALRSHVGIDVRLSRRLSFRYSFSETISGNPISPVLTPPAPRGLANFQNLFGVVARVF